MGLSKDPEKRAKQLNNLKVYKKGQTGNPHGRPRNIFTNIIHEYKENGFDEMPTRKNVRDCLMLCLTLNEAQLKQMHNDKNNPMLLRIIARNLFGEHGFNIAEKLLDRTIGKVFDVTSDDTTISKPEPIMVEIIDKAEQVDRSEEEKEG